MLAFICMFLVWVVLYAFVSSWLESVRWWVDDSCDAINKCQRTAIRMFLAHTTTICVEKRYDHYIVFVKVWWLPGTNETVWVYKKSLASHFDNGLTNQYDTEQAANDRAIELMKLIKLWLTRDNTYRVVNKITLKDVAQERN